MRRMLRGCGLLLLTLAGCTEPGTSTQYAPPPGLQTLPVEQTVPYGNPLFVPITDPQCVSDMTAEVIDDYFKIRGKSRFAGWGIRRSTA